MLPTKSNTLKVELQLLECAYTQAINANVAMALVPCSCLLLEKHEFTLFVDVLNKQRGPSQLCLFFDEQEIRHACATQLENLKTQSQLG